MPITGYISSIIRFPSIVAIGSRTYAESAGVTETPKAAEAAFVGWFRTQRDRSELPINHSSTARAPCRPSRMAHATRDWPRRMSPAANTPSTEVW